MSLTDDESAAESELRRSSPTPSLAERLKARFGDGVDPRVQLERGASSEPSDGSSPSSAVLRRLTARGPVSGRYRLEGELARGGMGAILEVFDVDLRRKLAMKVVLDEHGSTGDAAAAPTPSDAARLSRFLEEAQITGQLDHPGVVPVHELGLDANGHAYFTMRLVRGRDLWEIFKLVDKGAEGWSVTRAIGVLLKVCEAMAFAHAKGVVHRDLKPANVMVGEFGEVYVMDWGLARVNGAPDRHDVSVRAEQDASESSHVRVETDRRDGSSRRDDALLTMDGDVLGTPTFMPPEQARGRLEAIDERSDIYSVGAMLYRLLAGRAPYVEANEEPTAMTVLERILAGPPHSIAQIAPLASAELAAICEKAMARKREQRYADMLTLAEDLRAYLEGRVVAAYEAGAWAEGRKWIQRNRGLSIAAAAALLALVSGLSASVWLGRRAATNAELAEERRVAAEASALDARRQARVAQEVNSFLNDDLLAAIAPEHEGAQVTVRQVLDKAAHNLDGRFANEPQIEAALRRTIGTSYGKLGDFEAALPHIERAMELWVADPAASPRDKIESRLQTAWVWRGAGRKEEAIDLYEDIVAAFAAEDPPNYEGLTTANNDLGLALTEAGRFDEARERYEDAAELALQHLGETHRQTLVVLGNLARLESDMGDFEQAIARFEQVLPLQRAMEGERAPNTIATLSNLSTAYNAAGRYQAALDAATEGYELCLGVYGAEHPLTAHAEGNRGIALSSLRRFGEAKEAFEASVRVLEQTRNEEQVDLLLARGNLAGVEFELGRPAEALELSQRQLPLERRVLGESHPHTLRTLNRIASALKALNRLDEAERAFREALPLTRDALGDDRPLTIVVLENLGGVLYTQRRYDETEALTRQVLAARERTLGPEHPDVSKTTFNLAMVLRSKGDTEAARELFERATGRDSGRGPEFHPAAAAAMQQLGDLDLSAKQFESAEQRYTEALEVARPENPGADFVGLLLHQRATARRGLRRYDDALADAEEALEIRVNVSGEHSTPTRYTAALIAGLLFDAARFEDCERAALELHENCLAAPPARDEFTATVRALLVRLYDAWGKPEEAARWK